MAFKLLDRARMSVSGTPGTGDISLGGATQGYQTFMQAGISNGDSFPYSLVDGNNWEYGIATYSSTGNKLSRAVSKTSAQNSSPLSLSSRTVISACIRAEDIAQATALSGLTDVEVSPGPSTDGWTLAWVENDSAFELVQPTYAALPDKPVSPTNNSFFLAQLGDVSMAPGPFTDGYVVAWNNSANKFILVPTSSGQEIAVSELFRGVPGVSAMLLQYIAYKTAILPASGTTSRAYVSVAPTADCSLTIKINNSSVGTIDFAAGENYGVYTISTDSYLFAGGVIQVIAPASPDSTMANVSISIVLNAV